MLVGGGRAVWRIQELWEPSAIILEENADKKSDRSDPASGRFRGKKKIQNKMAREVGLSGVRVETSGDHFVVPRGSYYWNCAVCCDIHGLERQGHR